MIKRHPVYPYNICHNGVIRETGFADAETTESRLGQTNVDLIRNGPARPAALDRPGTPRGPGAGAADAGGAR